MPESPQVQVADASLEGCFLSSSASSGGHTVAYALLKLDVLSRGVEYHGSDLTLPA